MIRPIVHSKNIAGTGFDRSLMKRLLDLGYPMNLLDIQYRMHPQIALWPCQRFYNGTTHPTPHIVPRLPFSFCCVVPVDWCFCSFRTGTVFLWSCH